MMVMMMIDDDAFIQPAGLFSAEMSDLWLSLNTTAELIFNESRIFIGKGLSDVR